MTDSLSYPVLYILMRSDLASLNPGKMAAQACHAANQFQFQAEKSKDPKVKKLFDAWAEQASSKKFGTTIVLDIGNDFEIRKIIGELNNSAWHLLSGIVLDDTYPVLDGAVMHHIPVYTCGYVFGNKDNAGIKEVLGKYPLYK